MSAEVILIDCILEVAQTEVPFLFAQEYSPRLNILEPVLESTTNSFTIAQGSRKGVQRLRHQSELYHRRRS